MATALQGVGLRATYCSANEPSILRSILGTADR
jgi:hypothetical protein